MFLTLRITGTLNITTQQAFFFFSLGDVVLKLQVSTKRMLRHIEKRLCLLCFCLGENARCRIFC